MIMQDSQYNQIYENNEMKSDMKKIDSDMNKIKENFTQIMNQKMIPH